MPKSVQSFVAITRLVVGLLTAGCYVEQPGRAPTVGTTRVSVSPAPILQL